MDKARFQHDMAYGDFKDLNRRTAADQVLRDKAFNIAKIPKYDGYQRRLAWVVYNFLIKNFQVVLLKKNYAKWTISIRITQTNYYKIWEKKSTLIFYRQYLGC